MSEDTATHTEENLGKFLILKAVFQYVVVDKEGNVKTGGRTTGTYDPNQVELSEDLKDYCEKKGGKSGVGIVCQLPKDKRAKCTFTSKVETQIRPGTAPMRRHVGTTHVKCTLMD